MSNSGFLLAEDAALKSRLLNGLRVSDDKKASRPVQVFYRFPESETERTYPFATIELISLNHARIRQESEVTYYYTNSTMSASAVSSTAPRIDYFPSEYGVSELDEIALNSVYLSTEQMTPIDLVYQVSTYCRSQRHDRELTSGMLRYVFPMRRSYIEIPEDGTSRRCDLVSWTSADIMDQEAGYKKRIFRKVYTVQINSEIPLTDLLQVKRVLQVSGTLVGYVGDDPDAYPNNLFSSINW